MRYTIIVAKKPVSHPHDNDQYFERGGQIRHYELIKSDAIRIFQEEVHFLEEGFVGLFDGIRLIGSLEI